LDEKNEFAYETMGQLELQRENLEEAVKMFDKVSIFGDLRHYLGLSIFEETLDTS
jgi:hypothetical protein